MIVRSRPSLMDVLFATRGSILPRILSPLLSILFVSVGAVLLTHMRPALFSRLGSMPFTLVGLSLSIFMSFRNTACYDRWWEGRKLWGQLVIACRSFARQTATLSPDDRDPLLAGVTAFAAGLAARLRGGDEGEAIVRHGIKMPAAPNATDATLTSIGRRCRELALANTIDPIHYSVLEIQLTEMTHVQGGCERIKATPLPFSYSLLLHRTAYVFCLLLPFALAPALDWWTPLLSFIVSYAFFGLDALGDELGDPFGTDANDLPLDALVRSIEREMLYAMGRTDLPPALLPEDYVLL